MPHLAPLNWSLIFLFTNLQLLLMFTLLWWTFHPSYHTPAKASVFLNYLIPFTLFN